VTFLVLFQHELVHTWRQFVLFSAMSGAANAAVLVTINQAAASSATSGGVAGAVIILGLVILLYSVSQRALMVRASHLVEATVDNLRTRFVEALQAADLVDVERLNKSELYNCVSSEMQIISDGTLNLIVIGQAAVLVVMTMVYLAWLSLPALLIASMLIVVAASFHIARTRQIGELLARSFERSTALLEGFTDFVDGVKEVKLNSARSGELASYIRGLSSEVTRRRLETRELFTTNFIASQVTFFLLTGIIVFAVPVLTSADGPTVIKITASILFLIGPISGVVGGLPVLQRVNAAAEVILSVQTRLSEMSREPPALGALPPPSFRRLALRAVTFSYNDTPDERGFQIGPIDLQVDQGAVVFITGGNGSGKSTLLKLIAGLYRPGSGEMELNGQPVSPGELTAYRNLFSAIFSDNHLFRHLYGVPRIDADKAEEYLTLLEIQDKVQIVDRAFTTIALSSGQRKRLAMVALLLEDRPVCLFDEWAADQDPAFRRKFYREIIPQLRARGKTIIAVTHDERYFDAADFRVNLQEGRAPPVTGELPAPP
jgi:putative pyoverdin transport system ATP-binding/permease protein